MTTPVVAGSVEASAHPLDIDHRAVTGLGVRLFYRSRDHRASTGGAGLGADADRRASSTTPLMQTIQASQLVAGGALLAPEDPMAQHSALEKLSKWLAQACEKVTGSDMKLSVTPAHIPAQASVGRPEMASFPQMRAALSRIPERKSNSLFPVKSPLSGSPAPGQRARQVSQNCLRG